MLTNDSGIVPAQTMLGYLTRHPSPPLPAINKNASLYYKLIQLVAALTLRPRTASATASQRGRLDRPAGSAERPPTERIIEQHRWPRDLKENH